MMDLREKLLKGMLDLIVLRLVAEKSTHGYEIIQTIKRRYDVYLGPSTVYPVLSRLEAQGYLRSVWQFPPLKHGLGKRRTTPRKVYSLTPKGSTLLANGEVTVKVIVKPFLEVAADAERQN